MPINISNSEFIFLVPPENHPNGKQGMLEKGIRDLKSAGRGGGHEYNDH
jgi:hypothetical protein